jgi:hypothetical protein
VGNEQALAIIDACRMQLKELGIEEILIGAYQADGKAAYSYSGNPKTLAFMAQSLLLEVMFESIGNQEMKLDVNGKDKKV